MGNTDDEVLPEWLDDDPFDITKFEQEERGWATDPEWLKFKSLMQVGDEIREFVTPKGSFRRMEFKAGYAIVRQGKIIAVRITIRNDHWRPK